MAFKENLVFLRKSLNLSQEELAEKINVTRQAVSKWENGQSTPDMDTV
ncbi:MAG: helix-turn-helix domain-containing protein, partial [Eubacterium sp.]|nr:helix-turn-helix domain-containing protein [Eubacterium sp.]